MKDELPSRYSPADVERRTYALWEAKGYFAAEADAGREPYCIMIPPPNVTDRLHLGHALNNTLQDALIRFNRMLQHSTLWMPGTDHAGIATQTVVEKRILAGEGKRRTDFRREEFVARIQAWKDEYEATITRQLRLIGCSCDWRRQRFTMDDVCAKAVREAFFRLFADGLIYRGKRLVNWDPATQTVLADDEVEHEEVRGYFWYMRYPLVEPVEIGGERIEHLTVATTRPETMLGDTAVAMHPSDPRAGILVGRQVRLPIVGRIIPIIADEHVVLPNPDSEDEKARFSTGFLKVTPAHDPDDYQIGQRHALPMVNVLAPDGSVSDRHGWEDADAPEAQNLIGMDRFEAREAVVEFFRQEDLLEEVREYVHQVGHSYRSHVPIEPYLSDQWYIAVKKPIDRLAEEFGSGLIEGTDVPLNSLAGLALKPLLDGRIEFVPERYAKTYQAWLENLRDWPVSRQLWWGHQIPVWAIVDALDTGEWNAHVDQLRHWEKEERLAYVERDGGMIDEGMPFAYLCIRGEDDDEIREFIEKRGWHRDPDVLDTWFSSALWPFSTLGWPEKSPLLDSFYPGNVLCTAREIITLWVSRMVMMGQYCLGDIPFPDVFIHAMIQDGEGRKMSKSLGNGIDPLDIIDSHGTDAMRFTLALMTTQTQDVRMPVERVTLPDGREVNTSPKFDVGRNFANKLWNAARFVLMNLGEEVSCADREGMAFEDEWILARRNAAVRAVTDALRSYRFNDAAQIAYEFTWHEFCDWYLEIVKPRLSAAETAGQASAVLAFVLDSILRLLHPLMPFITEEVWTHLGRAAQRRGIGEGRAAADSVIVAIWPTVVDGLDEARLSADMTHCQSVVRAVRNIRSKMNISARTPLRSLVASQDQGVRQSLLGNLAFVKDLTGSVEVVVTDSMAKPPHSASEVIAGHTQVFVPLEGLIDLDVERARLEKQLEGVRGKLAGAEQKLSNQSFIAKAPAAVVERERAKAADLRRQLDAIESNLSDLK